MKIRFEINNEPKIDREYHAEVFHETFYRLTEGHYRLEFNTTEVTAYNIAKQVIEYCDNINGLKWEISILNIWRWQRFGQQILLLNELK